MCSDWLPSLQKGPGRGRSCVAVGGGGTEATGVSFGVGKGPHPCVGTRRRTRRGAVLHGGLSRELDNQAPLQLITLDHGARDSLGLSL